MTPYAVRWSRIATRQLAELYLQAADRNAVTRAEARLTEVLGQRPETAGEHLSEGMYRLTVAPLTVLYTVDRTTRRVRVSRARTAR